MKRIALVTANMVVHFEKPVEAVDGKAMIGCMSHRICVSNDSSVSGRLGLAPRGVSRRSS